MSLNLNTIRFELDMQHMKHKQIFEFPTRGLRLFGRLWDKIIELGGNEEHDLFWEEYEKQHRLDNEIDLAAAINFTETQYKNHGCTPRLCLATRRTWKKVAVLCEARKLQAVAEEVNRTSAYIERWLAAAAFTRDAAERDSYVEKVRKILNHLSNNIAHTFIAKAELVDAIATIFKLAKADGYKALFGTADGNNLLKDVNHRLEYMVNQEMGVWRKENGEDNEESDEKSDDVVEQQSEYDDIDGNPVLQTALPSNEDADSKTAVDAVEETNTHVVIEQAAATVTHHDHISPDHLQQAAAAATKVSAPVVEQQQVQQAPESFLDIAKNLQAVAAAATTPARCIERMLRAAEATRDVAEKQRLLQNAHEILRKMFRGFMNLPNRYGYKRQENGYGDSYGGMLENTDNEEAKSEFANAVATVFRFEKEFPTLFGYGATVCGNETYRHEHAEERDECMIKSVRYMLEAVIEEEEANIRVDY